MTEKEISRTCVKLGFLGDSSVGKTSICNVFMGIEFSQEMISTIGSDKLETKIVLNNGKQIKVVLWDTAGQERFHSMGLNTIKNANGVVVVFDVTNRDSFDSVNNWLEKIKESCKNPALVLFANKADFPKEILKVTNEEIEEFAKKMNLKFFETSAKANKGITEGMSYIANEAFNKITGNNIIIDNKEDDFEIVDGCFGKKKRRKKKNKAK